LELGWSVGFYALKSFTGITALGNGSTFTGVEENEFATRRFGDAALVGCCIPS